MFVAIIPWYNHEINGEIREEIERLGLKIGEYSLAIRGAIWGLIFMFLVFIDSWEDKDSSDMIFFKFRGMGPGVRFVQFRDFWVNLIIFDWALFL